MFDTNNLINNFIFSHGIIDIYNKYIYDISFFDYITFYLFGVIIIEYFIKKTKDLFIFIFIILSGIHFSFDFEYLLNKNNENIFFGLSIISLNILNKDSKIIYNNFFKLLNINFYDNIYDFLKIFNILILVRFIFCLNITICIIYLLIFLTNYFLNPIDSIRLYFFTIHIPINIYKNIENNDIYLYLILLNILIYFIVDYKKINYSLIITGLSISTIHILDNLNINYKLFFFT